MVLQEDGCLKAATLEYLALFNLQEERGEHEALLHPRKRVPRGDFVPGSGVVPPQRHPGGGGNDDRAADHPEASSRGHAGSSQVSSKQSYG